MGLGVSAHQSAGPSVNLLQNSQRLSFPKCRDKAECTIVSMLHHQCFPFYLSLREDVFPAKSHGLSIKMCRFLWWSLLHAACGGSCLNGFA
ncbi:hypothetical protein Bca101_060056 [Brassica carinata]